MEKPSAQTIPELTRMREGPFPFVGREPELRLIERILEPGRQGYPMDNSIISFVGPYGIGKTALLGEIAARHRKEPGSASTETHPSITAYVDLGQLITEGNFNRRRLVQEIWQQLGEQMEETVLDLGGVSDDELVKAMVDKVVEWGNKATPVILLDTFDRLTKEDERSFWWIEKEIMEPLVRSGRTLFVLAGRKELRRLRQFETRRRLTTHFLNSFDEETTALQTAGSPAVNAAIYAHTFGHPEAVHYLAKVLRAQGLNLATASEEEVVRVLKEILPTVLDNLTTEILRDVPEELKEIARQASVLRWINYEPLSFLAKYLNLEDEEAIETGIASDLYSTEEGYYLDIIGQLQEATVLDWNVAEADFRIPLPLRQLLDHALELRNPNAYGLAHQAALIFHLDHLERYPNYLARYVPQAFYHNLRLNELESKLVGSDSYDVFFRNITMAGPIDNWWPFHFDQQWAKHDQAPPSQVVWQELAEALEKDEELKALMHPLTYKSFLKEAKQRAELKS